jgi:Protein tyrosine and serine/threonine kinase
MRNFCVALTLLMLLLGNILADVDVNDVNDAEASVGWMRRRRSPSSSPPKSNAKLNATKCFFENPLSAGARFYGTLTNAELNLVSDSIRASGAVTIEFWARRSPGNVGSSVRRNILWQENGFGVLLRQSSHVLLYHRFAQLGLVVDSQVVLPFGWNHVAVSMQWDVMLRGNASNDGEESHVKMITHLNGMQQSNLDFLQTEARFPEHLKPAEFMGDESFGTYAGVSELRLFDYARNASEIAATMNLPLGPDDGAVYARHLVGYWRFNECTPAKTPSEDPLCEAGGAALVHDDAPLGLYDVALLPVLGNDAKATPCWLVSPLPNMCVERCTDPYPACRQAKCSCSVPWQGAQCDELVFSRADQPADGPFVLANGTRARSMLIEPVAVVRLDGSVFVDGDVDILGLLVASKHMLASVADWPLGQAGVNIVCGGTVAIAMSGSVQADGLIGVSPLADNASIAMSPSHAGYGYLTPCGDVPCALVASPGGAGGGARDELRPCTMAPYGDFLLPRLPGLAGYEAPAHLSNRGGSVVSIECGALVVAGRVSARGASYASGGSILIRSRGSVAAPKPWFGAIDASAENGSAGRIAIYSNNSLGEHMRANLLAWTSGGVPSDSCKQVAAPGTVYVDRGFADAACSEPPCSTLTVANLQAAATAVPTMIGSDALGAEQLGHLIVKNAAVFSTSPIVVGECVVDNAPGFDAQIHCNRLVNKTAAPTTPMPSTTTPTPTTTTPTSIGTTTTTPSSEPTTTPHHGSPSKKPSKSKPTSHLAWIIVGVVAAVLVVVALGVLFFLWRRRKQQRAKERGYQSVINASGDGVDYESAGGNSATLASESTALLSSVAHIESSVMADGSSELNMVEKRVGKYLIDVNDVQIHPTPLAKGGFSVVYRGSYANETVAIKMFVSELYEVPVDVFFREVENLARVAHPHVVRFVGAVPRPLSIITEFVERGSLYDVMRAEQLEWPTRLRILLDVARALAYMHSHEPPVLHRDMKVCCWRMRANAGLC